MNPVKDAADMSGMFGGIVSVKRIKGSILVKNRPRRRNVALPTEKQLAVQTKLKKAAGWAQKLMENQDNVALYAKKKTDKLKSPFMVALQDYLKAPVIRSIETSDYSGKIGDAIVIDADDDFMVTQVSVTLSDANGNVLEKGDAVQGSEKLYDWTYTATIANAALAGTKITATAYDRPGNKTSLDKVL